MSKWIGCIFCVLATSLTAAVFNPTNETELSSAIQTANFNGDASNTINFPAGGIAISNLLFPIGADQTFTFFSAGAKTLTFTGGGQNFSGTNSVRGFFIGGGTVVIDNLNLSTFNAIGGPGGPGGGGGAGLGGGIFVSSEAVVTLSNCTFSNCAATGGSAPSAPSSDKGEGGGGGLHGNGGTSQIFAGGGGGGWSGNGGNGIFGAGGGAGFTGNGGIGGVDVGDQDGGGGGGTGAYGGGGGGDMNSGGGGAASFSASGSMGITPTGGSGGSDGAPFLDGGAGGDSGVSMSENIGGGGGGSGASVTGGNGDALNGGDGATAISSGFGGGGGGSSPAAGVTTIAGNGGDAIFGGGGGGGAYGSLDSAGGDGGNGGDFGGGGGGGRGFSGMGGTGGFGGGGGGGTGGTGGEGGTGGFGGGGGGCRTGSSAGMGGFGGGNGAVSDTIAQGGGGAGFGGAIFIQTGGELTLSGSVSFASSSVAGGIGANNGMSDGTDIFMMSGSNLIFDISSNVTLQNRIASEQSVAVGGLTKRGSARLILSGANTYTGATTVEAGELRINGSVITNVDVQTNGTLTGNFDITTDPNGNGGSLTNSGLFSPGVDGIGTVNIEENYTNQATGTLFVNITAIPNQCDKIFVTGNTTINGGQLQIFVPEGNYIDGTQYEVIIGNVSGAFANQANPTQVGPFAGNIEIDVLISSLILVIRTNSIFNHQFIDPGVPTQVANCILSQTITAGSDFAQVVAALGELNDSQLNKALFSMSAVRYGSLEWINERNNSYAADILSQHLFELCCSPRNCCSCNCNGDVWMTAFGNIMDQKKQVDNLPRYNSDAAGILAGMDFCCGPCVYYGFAFGYTHTDFLWRGNSGNGKINKYYGALYGSVSSGWLTMDWSILGGGDDNVAKRKLIFGTINRTARGDYWSYFVTGHLGVRLDWCCCAHTFEEFALVDYHYYTHGKFTERGADSIDLTIKSKHQHMLRTEAGVRWYYEVDCGCYCYAPFIGLSWVGEFPLHKSKQPASFVGQSCVINATSFKTDFQLAAPQAGLKYTNCNGVSILLGYKGLFNNVIRINEIEGRLEWIF